MFLHFIVTQTNREKQIDKTPIMHEEHRHARSGVSLFGQRIKKNSVHPPMKNSGNVRLMQIHSDGREFDLFLTLECGIFRSVLCTD